MISTPTGARYLFTSEENLYALHQGGLIPVEQPLDAEIADIESCEGYLFLAYTYDGLYAMKLDVASIQPLESHLQVDVYPLPAGDQIGIHVKDDNDYVLYLYCMHTGEQVKREVRWSIHGYMTMGMNDVNSGIYILEIVPAGLPGQVLRKKIIVKK